MVNFHDPTVLFWDALAVLKVCHAVDGLYVWEFFTTLDYEWSVIRGQRPYRWTIWIYAVTRVGGLGAVLLNIICLNVTASYDCHIWDIFQLTFAYLAFVAASLLIVLRDIALWNRKKTVITIATGVWVTHIAFLVQGTARLHSSRDPQLGICVLRNIESAKPNTIATLITDVVLLLIMLSGLYRMRLNGGGKFGLGQLLWKQGVIWLVLATIVEATPVVFISLDLNYPLDVMFQVPSLSIMSICAARMYRTLTDVASGFTNSGEDGPQTSDRKLSKPRVAPFVPIPRPRMGFAMHTVGEQYSTSQASRPGFGSYAMEGQLRPPGLSLDSDLESRPSGELNPLRLGEAVIPVAF